jgi:hypothetical protein
MKFVLVTFRKPDLSTRQTRNPESGFQYPRLYDAQEVHVEGHGPIYDRPILNKRTGVGRCLIYIDDVIADKYDAAAGMRILTDVQADTWVAANKNVQDMAEYDVDADMVQAIQVRIAAGNVPTTQEQEMLDPDHPRRGIRRRLRTKEALLRILP